MSNGTPASAGGRGQPVDHEEALEELLALIYDSISLTNKGMRANPSLVQERKLIKRLAQLEVERTDVEGLLDAIAFGDNIDVAPPTKAQVKKIATLTGKVTAETRATTTATKALKLTGDALDLAMKLTA